jgi:hypothetical protein
MSTTKFREMREQLHKDPKFMAGVARERALMAEIDLAAARQATGMTQQAVAAGMGKSQENVSRIERQRDVRVSTLAGFVQAQGGQLEINAVFGNQRVSLMRAAETTRVQAKKP